MWPLEGCKTKFFAAPSVLTRNDGDGLGSADVSSADFGVSPKASETFAKVHEKVNGFDLGASRRDADWRRPGRSRYPPSTASLAKEMYRGLNIWLSGSACPLSPLAGREPE